MGIDDKELSQNAGIMADLMSLKKVMSKYCEKVIKGEEHNRSSFVNNVMLITVNVQVQAVQFLKKCIRQ